MLTETVSTAEPAFKISNYEIKDEDLPEFRDMKFEEINQLHLDHPGASDTEYRKRRDYIASLSKKFRETGVITDVEYTRRRTKHLAHRRHAARRIASPPRVRFLSRSQEKT